MRFLRQSLAVPSIKAGAPENHRMPNAVSLLRAARLARSTKPFLARGGFKRERCAGCRLVPSHCMCALRPFPWRMARRDRPSSGK